MVCQWRKCDPLLNGRGVTRVSGDALGASDFGMSGDQFASQAEVPRAVMRVHTIFMNVYLLSRECPIYCLLRRATGWSGTAPEPSTATVEPRAISSGARKRIFTGFPSPLSIRSISSLAASVPSW
jgi:hypothetical protein